MQPLYKARVTNGSLKLRSGRSTQATVITIMLDGTEVDVLEEHGKWSLVQYGGTQGYAMSEFQQRIEEPAPPVTTTTLICEDGGTVTLLGSWRIAVD